MPLATFNFPLHKVRTIHPDAAYKVTMGGSYDFVSKPDAPPQRIFILHFDAMIWAINAGTGFPDASVTPTYNYKALRNFYETVQTYERFNYPHPEFGTIVVRFDRPLEDPDPNGEYTTGPFDLQFKEQP